MMALHGILVRDVTVDLVGGVFFFANRRVFQRVGKGRSDVSLQG